MLPFRSLARARSKVTLIALLPRTTFRPARSWQQPTLFQRNSTTKRLSSTTTHSRPIAPPTARTARRPPSSHPSLDTLQRWTFVATALSIGALFGVIFSHTVAPAPLPEPGSEKDAKVLAELEDEVDELEIVKELRRSPKRMEGAGFQYRAERLRDLHRERHLSNPQADSAFFGWPAREQAQEAQQRRAKRAEERRARKKGAGPLHQDVKLDKLPTPEPQVAEAVEAAAAPNPWIELDPPASRSPTSKPLSPSPPSPSSLSNPERLDSDTPLHSPLSAPSDPPPAHTASTSPSASQSPSPSPYTHSTLPGSRALGHAGPRTVQRTFYNPTTRELVQAVWLGGALSGWPGVVHGGLIATVVGEAGGWCWGLSRVVEGADSADAGADADADAAAAVLAAAAKEPSCEEPKELSLTYRKPTTSNGFYVLRSRVETPRAAAEAAAAPVPAETPKPPVDVTLPPSKDLTKQVQLADLGGAGKGGAGDVEVVTTLENLEGKVCVKARMTFAR
ncbi:hypothetical protein W97_05551 [Coniosporium apollinis CBS 100218]|uniref:Thioesterase domain-containing protein n=1 Tax=Coniosporium apollinis (strain CBS 100218) TaxID=1168221 RepID=R7YX83_CONA1|nr:uncharacterized protein W97_05551 [Coniosporium apollinis CBS 100218]EON66453.1 hypothetical protein W97_05551 [Coniosporium apollinis CBS 100218]